MKTYTIGTSWKRLLAVSAVLSAVLTGYSGAPIVGTRAQPATTLKNATINAGTQIAAAKSKCSRIPTPASCLGPHGWLPGGP